MLSYNVLISDRAKYFYSFIYGNSQRCTNKRLINTLKYESDFKKHRFCFTLSNFFLWILFKRLFEYPGLWCGSLVPYLESAFI
ncbi:unnamed protein product [Schistosoma rodhaini]|uniref:Uncharacterized protein n=1 Tax=Schistosoma rodhaini TaxID=6188 RepID=A0AA85EKZ6_9TREM|nr:unnamed protein product [Schistosoma rodhaini]